MSQNRILNLVICVSLAFTCIIAILFSLHAIHQDEPCDFELAGIEQIHISCWGNMPRKNLCPHCKGPSFDRFCTACGKERGDLPFIGVYCPKCNPEGKYASLTSDVTKICGDCGSLRTWKYVYEDWQSEPNEEEGNITFTTGTVPTPDLPLFIQVIESMPVWPDYYEFEEDVDIFFDRPEPDYKTTIYHDLVISFKKGTKIYRK